VEETIASRLTAQIKALRDARGWDYKAFAEQLGKKVSWVYRLEDPNEPPPKISTLLEVAAACDVALDVRFCPYSRILDEVTSLSPNSFGVPSFNQELEVGTFRLRKPRKRFRKIKAGGSHAKLHKVGLRELHLRYPGGYVEIGSSKAPKSQVA